MFTINTQIDPLYQTEIDDNQIIAVIQSALQTCLISQAELTVVITTDEVVYDLNLQYRGIASCTDVLSFQSVDESNDFITIDEDVNYLGDIIIAAPTAHKQAKAANHSFVEEVLLLSIHGLLHLLGFDHTTPINKQHMWQKQSQILAINNLGHVKPTENT